MEGYVVCGMRYADVQILQKNRQPLSLLCLDDLLPYCIARFYAPIEVVLSRRSLLYARCARTNCIVAPARAMRTQKVRWKSEARIETTRVESLDLDQSTLCIAVVEIPHPHPSQRLSAEGDRAAGTRQR